MADERQSQRDLARAHVPRAGRLVETGDPIEPYRLLDAAGEVLVPVASYLRELQAADRSPATLRSYSLDLLRWMRFLWAVNVSWDRATQVEARDFARWLEVGGRPSRHSPSDAEPEGRSYSLAARAHSESVLRNFYDFHREAGTGPILNPFPLDRMRRGRRA